MAGSTLDCWGQKCGRTACRFRFGSRGLEHGYGRTKLHGDHQSSDNHRIKDCLSVLWVHCSENFFEYLHNSGQHHNSPEKHHGNNITSGNAILPVVWSINELCPISCNIYLL